MELNNSPHHTNKFDFHHPEKPMRQLPFQNNNDKRSDHALVAAFFLGDEQAFQCLENRHHAKIYTSIWMVLKDECLTDDLYQDAMLKLVLLLRAGRFIAEGSFGAWAVKIARNMAIDHYRRQRRGPILIRDNDHHSGAETSEGEDCIEKILIQKEEQEHLKNLLGVLPETQREVLMLRLFEALSFKEIAKAQRTNINTALGRMRYALATLRKHAVEDCKVAVKSENKVFSRLI